VGDLSVVLCGEGYDVERDPVAEIVRYNQRFVGRYPLLLKAKIERLASGPFGFFRGTFNVFARDMIDRLLDPWQDDNPFTAVETRLVGDIHSENYGTFKAADGSVRYDINDFDETTTGSFDFDCKRAATSLFLAAAQQGQTLTEAVAVVDTFMRMYIHWIVKFATKGGADEFGYSDKHLPASNAVSKLITGAANLKRPDFIAGMTTAVGAHRKIKQTPKSFELSSKDHDLAVRLLADYVHRLGNKAETTKGFYDIEDVCGRIAGCGSLGRLRMVILLAGEGTSEGKNVLLEFKESLPSAYDEYRGREINAVARKSRAATVAKVEQAMQTASNRYLGWAVEGEQSYQVKEIGPRDQRLDWADVKGHDEFQALATIYGQLLAKCHARADHEEGQAGQARLKIMQALQERAETFVKRIVSFAMAYSELVEDDQRRFVAARSLVEKAWLGNAG
jgi:uncharacterized protein (DUF2252 family)